MEGRLVGNRGLVLAVSLVVGAMAVPASARSLRDTLGSAQTTVGIAVNNEFDTLASNIADTAARSIPIISSSAGFTYRYNAAIGAFERTSDTLGPIFLERPDTLGRGKFNVNVSYQYVQFDQFDGTSLRNLQSPDPVVLQTSGGDQVTTRLRYSLRLQNHVTAVSATYGVCDDLDVNLLVPLIETRLAVGVHASGVGEGHVHDDAFGVGDILVRTKYQLPRLDWFRSAIGLQLRLPSGNENDFQGTGNFEASPFFYGSTLLWGRVEPHVNLGIDYNTGDVSHSAARYGAGVDVDAHPRIGFAFGFLGRSELGGSADRRDTLFLHSRNGADVREPLLGLDFGRKDFFDFSFGVRAVLFRNIMMFANGIYALNDSGLRNDTIIPTVGFEGTF